LLEDAIDYYRPAAEERGMEIVTDIEPGLSITADGDLIFQAMANLLDNAIKYGPTGGHIKLEAESGRHETFITLTDNGPGIAAEHRRRVIERFYRAPEVDDIAGVGLGLSLVDAVARVHRSIIAFEDASPGLRVRWVLSRS